MSVKDEEVTNTLQNAEEKQRLDNEARIKKENDAKDRSELTTIKARLIQQFQSPNSPYRGIITSPEEQNMIEDQAKMILGFVHNLYGIWERYGSPDQLQHNPRVILRPEQCEYFDRHNYVRNKSRMYRLWMEPPFSRGIILHGDNNLRTPQREQLMDRYEAFQNVCNERYT